MLFMLQWVEISVSWSFFGISIAMLKIAFIIAMEMLDVLPKLPKLLCPDLPEVDKLMQEKQNTSFGSYLLEQLAAEDTKAKLQQDLSLLNHEVIVNVTRAVVSLQPTFAAYRRGMRGAAKLWIESNSGTGGLLELASEALQLDKIIVPSVSFECQATSMGVEVRQLCCSRHFRDF